MLLRFLVLLLLTPFSLTLANDEIDKKIQSICKTSACKTYWKNELQACKDDICLYSVLQAAEVAEISRRRKAKKNIRLRKDLQSQFEVLVSRSCKTTDCSDTKRMRFSECLSNSCRQRLINLELKTIDFCDRQRNRRGCQQEIHASAYKYCFSDICKSPTRVPTLEASPEIKTLETGTSAQIASTPALPALSATPSTTPSTSPVTTLESSSGTQDVTLIEDEMPTTTDSFLYDYEKRFPAKPADLTNHLETKNSAIPLLKKEVLEAQWRVPSYTNAYPSPIVDGKFVDVYNLTANNVDLHVAHGRYVADCTSLDCVNRVDEHFKSILPASAPKSNTEQVMTLIATVDSRGAKNKRGEIIGLQDFGRRLAHPLKDDFEYTPPERQIELIFLKHGMFSDQMLRYFQSGAIKIPQSIKESYKSFYAKRRCYRFDKKSECDRTKELEMYYEAIAQYFGYTKSAPEGKKLPALLPAPGYFLALNNLTEQKSRVFCQFSADRIHAKYYPTQDPIVEDGFTGVLRVGDSFSDCLKNLTPFIDEYRNDLKQASNFPARIQVNFNFPGMAQWSFKIGESIKGDCHGFIFIPFTEKNLPFNDDWYISPINTPIRYHSSGIVEPNDTATIAEITSVGGAGYSTSFASVHNGFIFPAASHFKGKYIDQKTSGSPSQYKAFKGVTMERCVYESERMRHLMDPTLFQEFVFTIGDRIYHRVSNKHLAQTWLPSETLTKHSGHLNSPSRTSPFLEITFKSNAGGTEKVSTSAAQLSVPDGKGGWIVPLPGSLENVCKIMHDQLIVEGNSKPVGGGVEKPNYRDFACAYIPNTQAKTNPYLSKRMSFFKAQNDAEAKHCEHYNFALSDKPIMKYFASARDCQDSLSSYRVHIKSGANYASHLEVRFDGKSIFKHKTGSTCHFSYTDRFSKAPRLVSGTQPVETQAECYKKCLEFKEEHQSNLPKSGNIVKCEVEVGDKRRDIGAQFGNTPDTLFMVSPQDPKTLEQLLERQFLY